jgi:NTP pyrophosphatase (non-canonical NTP hydrolase)
MQDKREQRTWLGGVQERAHDWRTETIGDGVTPLSQAAHTSVEANELLDLLVKGETYYEDGWADDDARNELMAEAGDVVIAHLGTLSLMGLRVEDCIEAALEKNGARDWDGWQEGE